MKHIDGQMPLIGLRYHVAPDRIIEDTVTLQDVSRLYQVARRIADEVRMPGHDRILHECRKDNERYKYEDVSISDSLIHSVLLGKCELSFGNSKRIPEIVVMSLETP